MEEVLKVTKLLTLKFDKPGIAAREKNVTIIEARTLQEPK